MERKKTIQRDARQQIVASDPCRDVFTHDRDSAKERNNDLRTPIGHLTPWKDVANKCFGHKYNEYEHTEDPNEFSRLLVRAVHHRSEHMQVNNNEESGSTSGVHIA